VEESEEIAAIAALNEPTRRQLYAHVVAQDEPVDRDGAAAAVGVRRSVAAFHLDRLADLGLLEVEYRRPPGRRGPGAGRPAKFYKRASGELAMTVPERHYDVAADLLARAVEASLDGATNLADALRHVSVEHGRQVGRQTNPATPSSLTRLADVLSGQGYEPKCLPDGSLVLTNCPFHLLAERHQSLVCGMNRNMLAGVCEALGIPGSCARLEPKPKRCCVRIVPETRTEGAPRNVP
jgi:predicted ArsR family transcriptional regulator